MIATRLASTVLSTRDAKALAGFYRSFLGWDVVDDQEGWVKLRQPGGGGVALAFHDDERYRPPVWPTTDDGPPMMLHLDIAAANLDAGVAWAVECGATVAAYQPQDDVRVLLDPEGHPFCLFAGEV